jgi:hypothetical protein
MQTWNAALYNWLPSNGPLPRDETPFEWYQDIFTQTPIAHQQTIIHIPTRLSMFWASIIQPHNMIEKRAEILISPGFNSPQLAAIKES